MIVSNVLFIVAGLLLGLAFQGGMLLFLIPVAGVAAALGYMNLPRVPGGKTAPIPVITRVAQATGISPAVTPDIRNFIKDDEYNEPTSTLRVNQFWARTNADVNKATNDVLQGLKRIIPNAYSLIVFSPLTNFKEWSIREYCSDPNAQVATDVRITENSGLISQLFRPEVSRLLEGDLMGGKSLLYYIDNPMIKSLVAVPMLDREKNRIGAIVVDSLYPNAFSSATAQALTYIASTLYTLSFKSFASTKNYIAQQQFSVLYGYQHKFFQTMSVKDIFRQIFQYVKENIPYDRMLVLALDKQNPEDSHKEREGRVVCCDGIDSEQFASKKFTLSDKGLAVLALFKNRPVARDFGPGMNQYVPRIDDKEKRNMDFRQLFVMPVSSDKNASLAELAICLESRTANRYSEHEMELLKAFAGVAGFAYVRACQFEQGKDLASRDGLTGLINQSVPTGSSTISACS